MSQTNRDTSVVNDLFGKISGVKGYNHPSLSISNGLTDENKTLSDSEFCTMVDAISTIQDEKTRTKLNKILFRHMAFLISGRASSI